MQKLIRTVIQIKIQEIFQRKNMKKLNRNMNKLNKNIIKSEMEF